MPFTDTLPSSLASAPPLSPAHSAQTNPVIATQLPMIIQGGMGVGVSGWRLARAVAMDGQLGVVSGTGVNSTLILRLQNGDPGGHIRHALSHFPYPSAVKRILARYFSAPARQVEHCDLEEHRRDTPYTLSPMPRVQSSRIFLELMTVGAFVECFLAKEGHEGIVGINFLEKTQLSNLPGLYGAMLAGVDVVLMGAGIPREIPGVLDRFVNHDPADIRVQSTGFKADIRTSFDPRKVFAEDMPPSTSSKLKRPAFIAIVSSSTLASHLIAKANGAIQGFVVEGNTAGGHNAPPRGQLRLTPTGEPIYSEKDSPALNDFVPFGLPFWLAGSYASHDRLLEAQAAGARGIQVGTAFAFCDESEIDPQLKQEALTRCASHASSNESDEISREALSALLFTDPHASPTGFPFKIVQLRDTLSEPAVYEARSRICDFGYLREVTVQSDGSIIYRCPAEPVDQYVRKGGNSESTVGKKCLCNSLLATIGLPQIRTSEEDPKHPYTEPAIVTAGDDIVNLSAYLKDGSTHYSANDVLNVLLG